MSPRPPFDPPLLPSPPVASLLRGPPTLPCMDTERLERAESVMSRKTRTQTQRRARKARNAALRERALEAGPRIEGPDTVTLYGRGQQEPVFSLVGTGRFMAFTVGSEDGDPVLHPIETGHA